MGLFNPLSTGDVETKKLGRAVLAQMTRPKLFFVCQEIVVVNLCFSVSNGIASTALIL
jgi:hypothetical protein